MTTSNSSFIHHHHHHHHHLRSFPRTRDYKRIRDWFLKKRQHQRTEFTDQRKYIIDGLNHSSFRSRSARSLLVTANNFGRFVKAHTVDLCGISDAWQPREFPPILLDWTARNHEPRPHERFLAREPTRELTVTCWSYGTIGVPAFIHVGGNTHCKS